MGKPAPGYDLKVGETFCVSLMTRWKLKCDIQMNAVKQYFRVVLFVTMFN